MAQNKNNDVCLECETGAFRVTHPEPCICGGHFVSPQMEGVISKLADIANLSIGVDIGSPEGDRCFETIWDEQGNILEVNRVI